MCMLDGLVRCCEGFSGSSTSCGAFEWILGQRDRLGRQTDNDTERDHQLEGKEVEALGDTGEDGDNTMHRASSEVR